MLVRSRLILLVAVVLAIIAVPEVTRRITRWYAIASVERVALPPLERIVPARRTHVPSSLNPSPLLKESVNMPVPFIVQAPLQQWDAFHEEACEEASILMVLAYFGARSVGDAPMAHDAALQSLIRRATELGYPVDLTAEQAALLLRDQDPSLRVAVLHRPTVDQLQSALSAGSLVVVPAAGRMLNNPYFRQPGPLYHMLVVRGYTHDGYAITNDPGTRRGEAFVYRWEILLGATHDWNNGDPEHGESVVIVVGR